MRTLMTTVLIGLVASCLAPPSIAPSTAVAAWPQIRGEQVDGIAKQSSLLSRTSDVQLKVVWKQPLGSGYSSVATSGDRVVTGFCDEQSGYVGCFSKSDGRQLWRYRMGDKNVGENGSYDGPVATPAIGFDRVFMLAPSGDFFALDLEDGELAWKVNLVEKFEAVSIFYGFGASPIVHGDHVFLEVGGSAGNVAAFDPATGELVWAAGQDAIGYQNPVPFQLAGRDLVVSAGNTNLIGVDAESGDVVFDVKHEGQGGRGAWSLIPVPLEDDHLFLAHDDTRSKVVKLGEQEGDSSVAVETEWEDRSIRNSYNVPIAINGNLFAFSSRILVCTDSEGQLLWRSRKPGDGFMSSVDEHLVIMTKAGSLHLGKASTDGYQDGASVDVFENTTWSVPAIDGNSIFVRSVNEIARVDLVAGRPAVKRLAESETVGPRFQRFLDLIETSDNKQDLVDAFFARQPSTPYIEGDIVHFLLRGDYRDAAVAGDLFGARQERQMVRVEGTDLLYFAAKIPEDTRANYVFIADYETITDPLNPHTTTSSTLVEDIELVHLVGGDLLEMSWFDMPGRRPEAVPGDTYQLEGSLHQLSVVSKAMKGETIPVSVYTPPGFSSDAEAYPVVFVHGGGPALSQGKLHLIADNMMTQGKLAPSVIVFIDRGFNPMMGAMGYETMFADELIPMIRKQFNVSTDREKVSGLACGFDGVLAATSTLSHRDQVSRLGLHSLCAFELLQPMFEMALATEGPQVDIQMTWSRFELTNPEENWDMARISERFAKLFADRGQAVTSEKLNDGTDWICWRGQVDKTLVQMVGTP